MGGYRANRGSDTTVRQYNKVIDDPQPQEDGLNVALADTTGAINPATDLAPTACIRPLVATQSSPPTSMPRSPATGTRTSGGLLAAASVG